MNDLNRLHYTIFSDPANDAAVLAALGFAQGTYTTAALAVNTVDETEVTHSLGTDDILFGFIAVNNDATFSNKVKTYGGAVDVNGNIVTCNEPTANAFPGLVGFSTAATTGKIKIKTLHSATAGNTITVKWWARIRQLESFAGYPPTNPSRQPIHFLQRMVYTWNFVAAISCIHAVKATGSIRPISTK